METILTELKNQYTANSFNFSMICSMYLAGDHHKKLRQQIVKFLTGQSKPINKCGLTFVAETIKTSFEQTKLF